MTVKAVGVFIGLLVALADFPDEALLSNLDFFLNMEVVEELDVVEEEDELVEKAIEDLDNETPTEGENQ